MNLRWSMSFATDYMGENPRFTRVIHPEEVLRSMRIVAKAVMERACHVSILFSNIIVQSTRMIAAGPAKYRDSMGFHTMQAAVL